MVKVTIDGITVEVPEHFTILQAAQKAGVDIPYFCYHPFLKPAGLCRMCLVEVEGMPKLAPACVTQVRDGMVVKTNTEKVRKAQEGIIEFQLLHHPLDCPICDQAGECQLQDLTFRYGKATSRFVDEKELYPTKFYGPLIVHEQSRCILCKRCVRFCTEVMNGADWNVYWRASHSIIGSYEKDVVANYFTGNLVEICPVGAITSRLYRYKTRIWKLDFTSSTCAHCEVGCSLDLGVRENQLFKVKHESAHPSPWICDKGYYAFDFVNHSERILYPLKREENKMVSIDVQSAVSLVAERLGGFSANEVAGIIAPHFTNEDALSFKGLFNAVGSELCDYRVWGEDSLPVKTGVSSIYEVESAKNIVVVAGNVGITHPIVALEVAKAKVNGARLVVCSASDTFLAERADEVMVVAPSKEQQKAKELIDSLKGDAFLIVGTRADASLRAYAYQKAKEKGFKCLILDKGSNSKGMFASGCFCENGVRGILEAAKEGKVKALLVAGVDIFYTFPDYKLVKEAIENVEFLVVFDLFFGDLASYADVFLPITSFAEENGTTVNLFWESLRRVKAMENRGDSRQLGEWISLISEKMGIEPKAEFNLEREVQDSKIETPSSFSGNYEALVEYPFYRSALYSGWCSNFSEVASTPLIAVSVEDAGRLGVKEGDKVVVSKGNVKFEYTVSVREHLVKGAVVLDAGFDRFPVTALLEGSWITGVDVKRA